MPIHISLQKKIRKSKNNNNGCTLYLATTLLTFFTSPTVKINPTLKQRDEKPIG